MKLEDLKKQMLSTDEEFRKAYFSKDLKYNIGQMVLEARMIKGVTQGELAKEMGTKQPSIARVENGITLPSLNFLAKMASALGTFLVPPVFGHMKDFHDQVFFNENKNTTPSTYVQVSFAPDHYDYFVSTAPATQAPIKNWAIKGPVLSA